MFTEDDLSGLFERAVRDLDPPIHVIVAEAEWRGRRQRAHRRIWQALGGGFATVVTATAVLAGVSLAQPGSALVAAGSQGHHPGQKHTGKGNPSASPSPSSRRKAQPGIHTTPGVHTRSQTPPKSLMSSTQMLAALKSLLPAGSTLGYVNPYSTSPGNLEVDYNDGNGAVDFIIGIAPTSTFSPLNCPTPLWKDEGTRPAGALPISCAMRTLPDGSVERDAVYYADAYGFYGYSVYDQRPDGMTVFLQVANGINHTLPQVDRATPPGSMAEWEALAENPVWQ